MHGKEEKKDPFYTILSLTALQDLSHDRAGAQDSGSVLVLQCCHDKIPEAGWYKQQRFNFCNFRDLVVGEVGISPWLANGCLLSVSGGLSSAHMCPVSLRVPFL